jgi:fructokinase
VIGYFADVELAAVGVASFGPLDLDPASPHYGTMTTTPKVGWSGTPILPTLATAIHAPIGLDTDVNGAALGEGRWGAAQGMSRFAYMTVGTGIGVGVVVDETLLTGNTHPEAGHMIVGRLDGDPYPGNCPFHGDCLEGLASGPALEARFGESATWAGDDRVLGLAADYVARGLRNLLYAAAPERIVVGGGVSKLPGFHERVRYTLGELLAGYPGEPDLELLVSRPGLGDLSGLAGALVLAERALG